MRVWPWRAQSAFVLCFKRHRYKPDQGQPRNPFCLQTAAPKLLGVFRVSSTELPKRSLAISWGHTTLTDTEAEQAPAAAGPTWAGSFLSAVALAAAVPKEASRLCCCGTTLFPKTYKELCPATSLSCTLNNLIRGDDF